MASDVIQRMADALASVGNAVPETDDAIREAFNGLDALTKAQTFPNDPTFNPVMDPERNLTLLQQLQQGGVGGGGGGINQTVDVVPGLQAMMVELQAELDAAKLNLLAKSTATEAERQEADARYNEVLGNYNQVLAGLQAGAQMGFISNDVLAEISQITAPFQRDQQPLSPGGEIEVFWKTQGTGATAGQVPIVKIGPNLYQTADGNKTIEQMREELAASGWDGDPNNVQAVLDAYQRTAVGVDTSGQVSPETARALVTEAGIGDNWIGHVVNGILQLHEDGTGKSVETLVAEGVLKPGQQPDSSIFRPSDLSKLENSSILRYLDPTVRDRINNFGITALDGSGARTGTAPIFEPQPFNIDPSQIQGGAVSAQPVAAAGADIFQTQGPMSAPLGSINEGLASLSVGAQQGQFGSFGFGTAAQGPSGNFLNPNPSGGFLFPGNSSPTLGMRQRIAQLTANPRNPFVSSFIDRGVQLPEPFR